jgi:hypothetical protein
VDDEELRYIEDIEAQCKAGKSVVIPRQMLAMKHRHGMIGTGHFMKHWKYRSMAKCPRCRHHDEMARHVTKCEDTGAIEYWDKPINEEGVLLAKRHTYSRLVSLLSNHLTDWKACIR